MRDDVTKGPVQLANAQPIADRLNRGDQTEDDIDPANVYAAAGLAKDGIIDRIRGEMAAKFPNAPSPHLDSPAGGAIAYSYLQASAKFDIPYFDNDEPFGFTDSSGNKTVVRSFGIREKDDYAFEQLRGQPRSFTARTTTTGTVHKFPNSSSIRAKRLGRINSYSRT